MCKTLIFDKEALSKDFFYIDHEQKEISKEQYADINEFFYVFAVDNKQYDPYRKFFFCPKILFPYDDDKDEVDIKDVFDFKSNLDYIEEYNFDFIKSTSELTRMFETFALLYSQVSFTFHKERFVINTSLSFFERIEKAIQYIVCVTSEFNKYIDISYSILSMPVTEGFTESNEIEQDNIPVDNNNNVSNEPEEITKETTKIDSTTRFINVVSASIMNAAQFIYTSSQSNNEYNIKDNIEMIKSLILNAELLKNKLISENEKFN